MGFDVANKIILSAFQQAIILDIQGDGEVDKKITASAWNEYARNNDLSEVAEDVTVDYEMARDLIEKNLAMKYGITDEQIAKEKEAGKAAQEPEQTPQADVNNTEN